MGSAQCRSSRIRRQRAARRDPAEQVGDRLEQLVPLGGVVARRAAAAPRDGPPAVARPAGARLRTARSAPGGVRAARARPASRARRGTARAEPQLPRHSGRTRRRCRLPVLGAGERREQRGLADPRLAAEQRRRATNPTGPRPGRIRARSISRCRPIRAGASANSPWRGTSTSVDRPPRPLRPVGDVVAGTVARSSTATSSAGGRPRRSIELHGGRWLGPDLVSQEAAGTPGRHAVPRLGDPRWRAPA